MLITVEIRGVHDKQIKTNVQTQIKMKCCFGRHDLLRSYNSGKKAMYSESETAKGKLFLILYVASEALLHLYICHYK